ncbi:MAG: DUF1850 domain-containing protein [Clostridia bacterium]|nr:DUF1850 domain-containing protein [Clostridia bacterium]
MNFKPRKNTMTAVGLTAAAVMVMIFLVAACGQKGQSIVLRDADNGEVYLEMPVEEGDVFSVTFTHSVNRTDETEVYEVRQGKIYLTGCIYYDFGAGVATEMEEGWELSYGDDGEMIISGIDREIPELIYVVGTVSDHTLTIGGEKYSLRDICGRNAEVTFEID